MNTLVIFLLFSGVIFAGSYIRTSRLNIKDIETLELEVVLMEHTTTKFIVVRAELPRRFFNICKGDHGGLPFFIRMRYPEFAYKYIEDQVPIRRIHPQKPITSIVVSKIQKRTDGEYHSVFPDIDITSQFLKYMPDECSDIWLETNGEENARLLSFSRIF